MELAKSGARIESNLRNFCGQYCCKIIDIQTCDSDYYYYHLKPIIISISCTIINIGFIWLPFIKCRETSFKESSIDN